MVTKLIKQSGISADDTAAKLFDAVAKKTFMIITDKSGRNAYRLKRYLSMEMYLNIVKKRMAKFTKKNG